MDMHVKHASQGNSTGLIVIAKPTIPEDEYV